jgi:phenylacetate-CoA ligase
LPSIDTPESWSALLDCWDRVYDEAGVGCGEVVFFAFSFGPFLGFWTAFDGATRRGCLCIPGGGLSSVARLEVMRAQQATVLCCTPTYALRLGEVMREELGVSPDEFQVKNIIVAGEAGGSMPEIRDRIAAAWGGARVWDHHGMTEVGPVTYEARGEPLSLSVLEEAYLAEVIDPDSLREVGEGETGELILTTLRRTACPLLRYRTGDLVRKAYGGEEGNRSLVLRGGILGRLDEMVVVRGVNVYPTAMEQVIRGFDEVAEFQVRQFTVDSMSELKVIIEPIESVAEVKILAENVERALNNAFALRIPVELAGSGGLPRFEFKANRWIKK